MIYQRTIWAECRAPLFDVTQILFDRTFAPGTAKAKLAGHPKDPFLDPYDPYASCGNPRLSPYQVAVEIPLRRGEWWRVEVDGDFVGTAQMTPGGKCEVIQPEGGS